MRHEAGGQRLREGAQRQGRQDGDQHDARREHPGRGGATIGASMGLHEISRGRVGVARGAASNARRRAAPRAHFRTMLGYIWQRNKWRARPFSVRTFPQDSRPIPPHSVAAVAAANQPSDARTSRSRNHAAGRCPARDRALHRTGPRVRPPAAVAGSRRSCAAADRPTRRRPRSTEQVLTVSNRAGYAAGAPRHDREVSGSSASRRRAGCTTMSTSCSTTVPGCATTIRAVSARCYGFRRPPRNTRCCGTWGPSPSTLRSTPTTCGRGPARGRRRSSSR